MHLVLEKNCHNQTFHFTRCALLYFWNSIDNCSNRVFLYVTPDVYMIFWYCSFDAAYWRKNFFFFFFKFWGCFEVVFLLEAVWCENIFICYTFFKKTPLFSAFHYKVQYRYFPSNSETHITKYFLLPNHGNWEWKWFRGGDSSQRAELQTTEDYSQALKPNGFYPVGCDSA